MVDFQWHPTDPYTMMSVSEDQGGGTLQLWRICDLVTQDEKEALAELDKHKCGLQHCVGRLQLPLAAWWSFERD